MNKTRNNLKIIFGTVLLLAFLIWVAVFNEYKADVNNYPLKIYFLNVGQGDSEYLKMPNGQDILIDGGPDDSVLTELGKVMDFGDRKIDLVVLTHPHADHLTGLIPVINRFEIGEVWQTGVGYDSAVYSEFQRIIKERGIVDRVVTANDNKSFGLANFFVLTPLADLKNKKIDNLNNTSIVNFLEFGSFTSLFLADLEKSGQAQILNSIKPATVVKIGHHGSANAFNEDLLKIARPVVSIISVGAKNNYGHPSAGVVNFFNSLAVQIYRTDQDGRIEISSDGVDWKVIKK